MNNKWKVARINTMNNYDSQQDALISAVKDYCLEKGISQYNFKAENIKPFLENFGVSFGEYLEMQHTSMMFLEAKQRKNGGKLSDEYYHGCIGFIMINRMKAYRKIITNDDIKVASKKKLKAWAWLGIVSFIIALISIGFWLVGDSNEISLPIVTSCISLLISGILFNRGLRLGFFL